MMIEREEPISWFLRHEGFRPGEIADYAIGELYTAVMNTRGEIGVCATLGTRVDDSLFRGAPPDPGNPSHRILLNAWFNSVYNYRREYTHITDIFDALDFRERGPIVMAGYFESLYEKFAEAGIDLAVFDLQKSGPVVADISGFSAALAKAKTVILTGTTIFNNTFREVLGHCSRDCSVYLLGPSNILSEEMFSYPGIRVVFGSVFERENTELLRLVREGQGTKGFLHHLKKVYIAKEGLR